MSFAVAILWFLYTRPNVKIIITGPKFEQIQKTIWTEVKMWLDRSALRDELRWNTMSLYHTRIETNYATIMTTKQKDNIQGFHAPHILWVLDEASNIPDEVFDAIWGGMSDMESKILIGGNLTRTSGFFYRISQIENKPGWNPDTGWKILQFNSEQSERAPKQWLKDMKKFPRDSDMYRIYVLGLPPSGSPRAIMTVHELEEARLREIDKQSRKLEFVPLELGLDPAAEGQDLTAIAIRYGWELIEIRTFSKQKAPETVLQTLKIVREFRAKLKYTQKVKIKVDDTAYGNAIRHYLALNDTDNIEVVPVIFGGAGDDNYGNMATRMWFNMANLLHQIKLPNDDDLIEQLAAREWRPHGQNRMIVESKREYKARVTSRKADKADATILAFWDGTKKIFSRKDDAESNVKAFPVDWKLNQINNPVFDGVHAGNVWHVCALVLNEDLSMDGVCTLYEYYKNRLWVYADMHYELPIAEMISAKMKEECNLGMYEDHREAKILGNSRMFKKTEGKRPFSDALKMEGIHTRDSAKYDEYGAIALGVALFKNNNVIIHRNAINARQQFNEWSIKDGRPDKKNFGCCEAALLVFSELKQLMKEPPPPRKERDYRPVPGAAVSVKTSNLWMGR